MKKFNIKLFIIIITTVISMLIIINNQRANAEVYYVCNVCTSGHAWYNPFSWFSDYETIDWYGWSEYTDGNWVFYSYYTCDGIGSEPCDFCENGLTASPNDNILDQDFMDTSANLLKNHVISEVGNGNYSGYQSFNTIVNGYLVYRNISWSSNTETSEIEVHINIYHE